MSNTDDDLDVDEKTPRPGPRSEITRIAKNRRIERIEEMLGRAHTTAEIIATIAKEFGVAERTAYNDLTEAYAAARLEMQEESKTRLALARRNWGRRMRRAEDKGDENAANYALDRLCRLDGLYAPKKIEMSGSVGLTVKVEMRSIIGVLDAAGLAALELVMQQVEAARARGELPTDDPDPTRDTVPARELAPVAAERDE